MAIQFFNNPKLRDNVKIELGDSSDLQIYHDGTNSFITNSNGDLTISNTGDDLILKSADDFLLYVQGTELAIQAIGNGGVVLRHNNAVKFETTSAGVDVTGQINANTGSILRGSEGLYLSAGGDTANARELQFTSSANGGSAGAKHTINATSGNGMISLATSGTTALTVDQSQNATFAGDVTIDSSTATLNIKGSNTGASLINFADAADGNVGRIYYDHTSNFMQFKVNDTEKMRINSSGFVGIGSNNPIAPLEVKSSEQNHLTLYRPTNTTEGIAGNINFDGNDSDSAQQTYAKISSFTDDPAAGTPAGKLSFSIAKGGDGMTSAMTIQKDAQVSLNQYGSGSYTGTAAYTLQVDSAGNIIEGSSSGGGTITGSGTATQVAFFVNNNAGGVSTELSGDNDLYWDNTNDRLGVGTNVPGASLEIFGTGNTLRLDSAANGSKEILFRNVGTGTATIKTDGDLKLYAEDANKNILFETNGGEAMRITSAGNVGIGTTSPANLLTLNESTNNTTLAFYNDGTNASNRNWTIGSNDQVFGDFSIITSVARGGNPTSNTTGVRRLYINPSGNVGIGTTSPTAKLHVSDSSGGGAIKVAGLITDSSAHYYGFMHDATDLQGTTQVNTFYSGGAIKSNTTITDYAGIRIDTPSVSADAAVVTNNYGVYQSSSLQKNYFAGNVGIGTTTPGNKLHIQDGSSGFAGTFDARNKSIIEANGEAYLATYVPDNSYSGLRFFNSTTLKGFIDYYHGTQGNALVYSATGYHKFMTSGTEKVRIINNGNVGIGTTAPAYKLDVSGGSIAIRGNVGGTSLRFDSIVGGTATSRNALYVNASNVFQIGNTNYASNNITGDTAFSANATFAGNVGIGTTAPSSELDLGDGQISGVDVLYGDSSNSLLIAGYDKGSVASSFIALYTSNGTSTGERMRIKSTGQVQFNAYGQENFTGTSAYLLAVESDGDIIEVGPSDLPGGPYLPLAGGTMSSGAKISFDANNALGISFFKSGGSLNLIIDSNNNTTTANFIIEKDTQTAGSGTELFRVQENGNVGIGVTDPAAKLEISETTTGIGAIIGNTTHNSQLQIYTAAAGKNSEIWFGDSADDNVGKIDYDHNINSMLFTTNAAERMRITSAGNLAIGTTSATSKLTISDNSYQILLVDTSTSNRGEISVEDAAFGFYADRAASTADSSFFWSIDNLNKMEINLLGGGEGQLRLNDYGPGNITGTAEFILGVDSNGNVIETSVGGSGTVTGTGAATRVAFWSGTSALSSDANLYWDNTNDRLGIGTTTPAQMLEVNSSAHPTIVVSSATDDCSIAFKKGTGATPTWRVGRDHSASDNLTFAYSATSYPSLTGNSLVSIDTSGNIHLAANQAYISFNTSASSGNPKIKMESDGDFSFLNTAGSSSMRIENGGNVGINTTSPDTKLDVVGGILRNSTRVSALDNKKYPLGHYNSSNNIFDIDPTWSQDELRAFFNNTNVAWVADADAPGGYAIEITGGVYTGAAYQSGFPFIPIDTSGSYYMECYIKNVTAGNTHYMGGIDFNESFGSLGGNPGSFGYWVMINTNPGTSWTKVSGTISGFGTSTGQFKAGTKYMTPMSLFNYSGTVAAASRVTRISGWRMIRTDSPGSGFLPLSGGTMTGNIDFGGTTRARFGSSQQLQILHSASGFIHNTAGDLEIRNYATDKDIRFMSDDGSGGETTYFYLDGSSGLNIFSKDVSLADNVKSLYGSSSDLQIYHDGNSKIETSTGSAGDFFITAQGTNHDLYLQAADDIYLRPQGTENGVIIIGNAEVKLYYNNIKKFETTTTGVKISDNSYTDYFLSKSRTDNSQTVGFKSPSGGDLELYSDDTLALTLDSSQDATFEGDVGIGISPSGAKLDVLGNLIIRRAAASTQYTEIESGGGESYIKAINGAASSYQALVFQSGNNTTTTERMRIDSAGNVGIGTSSPAEKLQVAGSIKSTSRAILGSATAGVTLSYDTTNSIAKIETWTSKPFSIETAGAERMRITSAGNVGIGTTAPQSKLQVGGTSTSDASINIGGIYGVYNWTRSYVASNTLIPAILNQAGAALINGGAYRVTAHISGTGTDQSSRAVFWNQNGTWHCNVTAQSGDTSNQIQFLISSSVPSVKTYHSGNYSIRVWHERIELAEEAGTDNTRHYFGADSYMSQMGNDISMAGPLNGTQGNSGSVGIGTATPTSKLEIRATAATHQLLALNRANSDTAALYLGNDSSNDGVIAVNNGELRIGKDVSGTFSEYVRIDDSGNVGIGATAPGAKLEVVGDSRIYDSLNVGYRTSSTSTTNYEPKLILSGKNNYSDGTTWYGNYGQLLLSCDANMTSSARRFLITNALNNNKFAIVRSSTATVNPAVNSTNSSITDGTADFVIDNEGKIGIGTTSPLNKLSIGLTSVVSLANQPAVPLFVSNNGQAVDGRVFIDVKHTSISGAAALGAGLRMQAAAVTTGTASYNSSLIFLQSSAPGSNTIHSAPKAIQFYVDNHDTDAGSGTSYTQFGDLAMTIAENTNVGIGTTNPGGKLSVSGIGTSIAPTVSLTNTSADNFNHNINAFAPNLTTGKSNILVFGKAGSTKNSAYVGYRYSGTSGSNDNLLILGHWASDNLMTISGDGNVGIGTGTTTPASKLHVVGSGEILRLESNTATGSPYLSFAQTGTRRSYIQHVDSGDDLALASEYGGIRFYTGTSGTETEKMVIQANGTVGIGTTNPVNPLQVTGKIYSSTDIQANSELRGGSLRLPEGGNSSDLSEPALFIDINVDGTVYVIPCYTRD